MSQQNATPPHILVVDDDPGILRLLTMRLRSWDAAYRLPPPQKKH